MIDGKEMTVPEIAEMLGVSEGALYKRRSTLNGCSYQMIVNMARTNQLQSCDDHWHRHLVDGEWITVQDAAQRVGVTDKAIRNYRCTHRDAHGNPATLADAIEHFRKYKTGEVKRYKGSVARVHIVNGRRTSVPEMAKKLQCTRMALYKRMYSGLSLDAAVRKIEKRKEKRAEQEIMKILGL